VEVEVLKKLFLDASADAVAEQRAVWNNDSRAGWLAGLCRIAMQLGVTP
jgi:hypothetical protein